MNANKYTLKKRVIALVIALGTTLAVALSCGAPSDTVPDASSSVGSAEIQLRPATGFGLSPQGGTITSVTAGSGLAGGGNGGPVTVAIDPTYTQRRVAACGAGSAVQSVNQDGTVVCIASSGGGSGGTTYFAGAGLTLTGSTFSMLLTCSPTNVLAWNGTTWACSTPTTGTVTSVATGTGLSGGPITSTGTINLNITPTTCSSHQAETATATDGTATCTTFVDGATANGGLALSTNTLGLITTCSNGNVLAWNSGTTSWGCSAPTTGTVTSIIAGTGLSGGTITSTGTIAVNLTTTSCAAHKAEITTAASGTSTCGTFVDGVTANGGLALSTSTLGLITTCSNGNVLAWNSGTTAWACSAPTTGTVTSVATGTGLTGGPITGTGTISLNITPTTCASHKAETATAADGTATCGTFVDGATTNGGLALSTSTLGLITTCSDGQVLQWSLGTTSWGCATVGGLSGGTPGTTPVWATSTTLGNGTTTDNGTTFKVGNVAGTVQQDSTTTGSVNDYALGATTSYLVFTNNTNSTLTGITGGVDGRVLWVSYSGANNSLTLSNESASSAAADRIHGNSNADVKVNNSGGGTLLIYDGTASRWRVLLDNNLAALNVAGATTLTGAATLSSTLNVTSLSTLGRATVTGAVNTTSLTSSNTSTGWTTSGTAAISAVNSSSWNTTSGIMTTYGINATNTAVRGSGTNSLVSIAGYFTSTGAQTNQALVTGDGDVSLNQNSGTTTIWGAATLKSTTAINGATTITGATGATSLGVVFNQTGQTTNQLASLGVSGGGSFDTTGGARTEYGLEVVDSNVRSAGTNALTNVGIDVNVSGAQVNQALVTENGDVILGLTSGNTRIGSTLEFLSATGHIESTSTALTTSNLSSCGTTPSISTGSTDTAGTLTEGTTATGCTVTFANSYTNSPFCVATASTSISIGVTTTATTMVLHNVSASGDVISWYCIGRSGGT